MTHIDDETLALIALDAVEPSSDEREHLEECDVCGRELETLQHTVKLGKSSRGVMLEHPSPIVWDRIQAEIATAPSIVADTRGIPRRHVRSAPRRRVRLAVLIPVTAAIAVAAAIGGIVSSPYLHPVTTAESTVVERATLQALPGWNGAVGTATLRRSSDGHLSLTVEMTPGSAHPPAIAGPLREVWLMRPDLSGLMSMGFLTSGRGTFAVPSGIDVSKFGLVDISAQAANGNPAHSGQSIMRGTLRPEST